MNAPKHTQVKGNTCDQGGFRPSDPSPIVLDIGKSWGAQRLVKFGWARDVTLDANNEPVVTNNVEDRNICLFGRYPESSHGVNYATFRGYIVNSNNRHTDGQKEHKRSGNIPTWMNAIYNDPETDKISSQPWTSGDKYEAVVLESITTDIMVVVNIYIACLWKIEQKGGNRCCRGIWGAGLGNGGHNHRMWRNLLTDLRLPKGTPLPSHSVYGNMPGQTPPCNKNKNSDWKEKGFNGDKPISPGIVWRIDSNGSIWLDSSTMGMAIFGNDNTVPVACVQFIYPRDENAVEADGTVPENPPIDDTSDPDDTTGSGSSGGGELEADISYTWTDDNHVQDWLMTTDAYDLITDCLSKNDETGKIDDVRTVITAPYGTITVESSNGVVSVDAWVSAPLSTSSTSISKRSIKCDIGVSFNSDGDPAITSVSNITTVLLEPQYKQGYYYATGTGTPPTGLQWIGQNKGNAEVSATGFHYIYYTADGKVWTLIDQYQTPNTSYYYLISTGSSALGGNISGSQNTTYMPSDYQGNHGTTALTKLNGTSNRVLGDLFPVGFIAYWNGSKIVPVRNQALVQYCNYDLDGGGTNRNGTYIPTNGIQNEAHVYQKLSSICNALKSITDAKAGYVPTSKNVAGPWKIWAVKATDWANPLSRCNMFYMGEIGTIVNSNSWRNIIMDTSNGLLTYNSFDTDHFAWGYLDTTSNTVKQIKALGWDSKYKLSLAEALYTVATSSDATAVKYAKFVVCQLLRSYIVRGFLCANMQQSDGSTAHNSNAKAVIDSVSNSEVGVFVPYSCFSIEEKYGRFAGSTDISVVAAYSTSSYKCAVSIPLDFEVQPSTNAKIFGRCHCQLDHFGTIDNETPPDNASTTLGKLCLIHSYTAAVVNPGTSYDIPYAIPDFPINIAMTMVYGKNVYEFQKPMSGNYSDLVAK